MYFTWKTTLLAIISSGIATGVLYCLVYRKKGCVHIHPQYLLLCVGVICARYCIPYEFEYTITLTTDKVLPLLQDVSDFAVPILSFTIWHIFLVIWFSVGAGKLWGMMRRYRKIRRMLSVLPDSLNQSVLNKFLLENRIKSRIRLVELPNMPTPVLLGLRNSVIIIPDGIAESDFRYIILHELEHYKKHDLFFILFMNILRSVYWWNPFIYILNRIGHEVIEQRVDRNVTLMFDEVEKVAYLKSILNIMKKRHGQASIIFGGAALCEPSMNAERRFYAVLGQKSKTCGRFLPLVMTFFVALSTWIIVEPSSVEADVARETFGLSTNECYLIRKVGQYDLYVDGEYIGSYGDLSYFGGFPVYENEEDIIRRKNSRE